MRRWPGVEVGRWPGVAAVYPVAVTSPASGHPSTPALPPPYHTAIQPYSHTAYSKLVVQGNLVGSLFVCSMKHSIEKKKKVTSLEPLYLLHQAISALSCQMTYSFPPPACVATTGL